MKNGFSFCRTRRWATGGPKSQSFWVVVLTIRLKTTGTPRWRRKSLSFMKSIVLPDIGIVARKAFLTPNPLTSKLLTLRKCYSRNWSWGPRRKYQTMSIGLVASDPKGTPAPLGNPTKLGSTRPFKTLNKIKTSSIRWWRRRRKSLWRPRGRRRESLCPKYQKPKVTSFRARQMWRVKGNYICQYLQD